MIPTLTGTKSRSMFRVFVAPELAKWLAKARAMPRIAALPIEEQDWLLVWMQQLLLFLARTGVERPETMDVTRF
jgi:hypothetical protein